MSKKLLGLLVAASVALGSFVGVGASAAVAATVPSDISTMRATIINDTNAYRTAAGQPPLQFNSGLNNAAQNWAGHQADTMVMEHDPNYVSKLPAGYTRTGENVAFGVGYTGVVDAWFSSPGHKANLLGLYNEIGIGVAYDTNGDPYYTQYFGYNPNIKTVPGAPREVTAAPGGSGEAVVSFTANTNTGNSAITGYVITATPTNGAAKTFNVTTDGTHTISGLTGGVTYNITVKAVNNVGQSASSSSVSVTAIGVPTVAVTSMDALPYSVNITWQGQNNGSAISSYILKFNGGKAITLPGTTVNYSFDKLSPGTFYSGSIIAVNGVGQSEEIPYSFHTPAVAPDSPPAPTATVINKTSISISWTKPAYDGGAVISNYDVVITEAGKEPVVIKANANARNLVYENAVRGKDYTVGVKAINSAGSSNMNNISINVPYTAPTAVTGLISELADERVIRAEWLTPSDNGGVNNPLQYVVTLSKVDGSGKNVPVSTKTTTNLYYEFANLDRTTNYVVSVVASNSELLKSAETFSNIVNVPAEPTVSAPVENLTYSNITGNSATIEWNAPSNNGGTAITSYKIVVTDKKTNTSKETIVNASTRTHEITSLERFTNYSVSVSAGNKKGYSDPFIINFATPADVPSAATVVDVAFNSNTSTPLTPVWVIGNPEDDGGDNNINFEIVVSTSEGNETFIVPMDKNNPVTVAENKTVSGIVKPGQPFNVTVKAVNSAGQSSPIADTFAGPVGADSVNNINYAFNSDNSRVTFTWSEPENAGTFGYVTGYKVKISDTTNNNVYYENTVTTPTVTINTPYGKTLKTSITPLTHDTKTFPGVNAELVSSRMPVVPPSVAQNVILNPNGPGSVKITWDKPVSDGGSTLDENATIELMNNTDPDSPERITVVNVPVEAGVYVFDKVRGGTNVIARVTVSNEAGNSNFAYSNATKVGATVPEQPLKVSATLDTKNDTTVNATLEAGYNGGSTITGYEFVIRTDGYSKNLVTTSPEAAFTGLARGKTYVVDGYVLNAVGKSIATVSNSIEVPAVAPTKPTLVTKTVTSRSATIEGTVTNNGGAPVTAVQYSYEEGTWVNVTNFDAATGKFVITADALQGLESYTFKVKATNKIGDSETATLNVTTPSKAPEGVTITNVTVQQNVVNTVWTVAGDLNEKEKNNLLYRLSIFDNADNVKHETTTGLENGMWVGEPGFDGYVVVSVSADNGKTYVHSSGRSAINIAPIAPGAPNSLTQTVVDSITTGFVWKTPTYNGGAPVTGYRIIVSSGENVVVDETVTEPQLTGLRLAKGKTYEVEVSATNIAGTGTALTQVFVTGTTPPSVVKNVKTVGSDNNVTFMWDAPEDDGGVPITGYRWVLTNTVTGKVVDSGSTVTETETPTITVEDGNVLFKFEAWAKNSNGESKSTTVDYRSPVLVPTVAPSLVGAKFNAENTALVVDWKPALKDGGETTQFIIEITGTDFTHTETVNVTDSIPNTVTIKNDKFGNNKDYEVTIRSRNSKGESPASAATKVTSNIVKPVAADFVYKVESNILTVTTASTSNNGGEKAVYELEVSGVSKETVTPGNPVNYVLQFGTTYTVTLTTSNSAGNVQKVKEITIPATNPATPTVTVEVNPVNNDSTITATPGFDGGAKIVSYKFTVMQNNKVVKTVTSDKPTITVKGDELNPNENYVVDVVVNNSAELSSEAYRVAFATNIIAPNSPSVSVDKNGSSTVVVTATAPMKHGGDIENLVMSVDLYEATTGKNVYSSTDAVKPGEVKEITVNGLTYATEYYANVRASNSVAGSETVRSKNVKTDGIAPEGVTGVTAEITGETSAKVSWKAPANNGGSEITNYLVTVYNVNGEKVAADESQKTSIEFSGLARGETYSFTVVAVNAFGKSGTVSSETVVKTAPQQMVEPLPEEMFEKAKETAERLDAKLSGKEIIVTLENVEEYTWYAGFAYSEPQSLGWSFVKNGKLVYDISNVPAGNHTFALYTTDGVLAGVYSFAVKADVTPGDGTNNTGDTDRNATSNPGVAGKDVKVKRTGGNEAIIPLVASGLGLLLITFGVYVIRRRREENTIN